MSEPALNMKNNDNQVNFNYFIFVNNSVPRGLSLFSDQIEGSESNCAMRAPPVLPGPFRAQLLQC